MSDTRRTRLADFLGRLVSEKPLGVVGGVIVLLLIVVAVFADVLSPYPFDEVHWQIGCKAHRRSISVVPTRWAETC